MPLVDVARTPHLSARSHLQVVTDLSVSLRWFCQLLIGLTLNPTWNLQSLCRLRMEPAANLYGLVNVPVAILLNPSRTHLLCLIDPPAPKAAPALALWAHQAPRPEWPRIASALSVGVAVDGCSLPTDANSRPMVAQAQLHAFVAVHRWGAGSLQIDSNFEARWCNLAGPDAASSGQGCPPAAPMRAAPAIP